jgi:hypothetical protein
MPRAPNLACAMPAKSTMKFSQETAPLIIPSQYAGTGSANGSDVNQSALYSERTGNFCPAAVGLTPRARMRNTLATIHI